VTNYYLDTNICIYLINNKYPQLKQKLSKSRKTNIKIPSVVYFELCHGAEKSAQKQRSFAKLDEFVSEIDVIPFDARAAEIAGRIRVDLERKGQVIGGNDILIAATAIANGATLVTNNTREFERVEGLRHDNWVQEAK
jgi:tRNA(fMet)-specific endonuclease VapC